ncbi:MULTISPECIES: response regulator transcription factor [unclassified Sphingomonas]|uniref:response regulator transcription factor n=1 Tax=unclassified Sphingomonas TaxID=196159 RepID=UPI002269D682|nr:MULTISPECIES: response regulator transcription factor [unclassified Sphingomonas]
MMAQSGSVDPRLGRKPHLLVVDDDESLARLLANYLSRNGFEVGLAANAVAMKTALATYQIDLIILDLMLPGDDGLTILRELGAQPGKPAVLMFSAYSTDTDRIAGLDLGAEDFVQKPCSPPELLARIKVALRRAERTAPDGTDALRQRRIFRFQGWMLDATMRVLLDPSGVIVHLSEGELSLLLSFVEQPKQLLTRTDLLDSAPDSDRDVFDRNVDVQVSRLRRKMAGRVGSLEMIRTIRGQGYTFDLPVVASLEK